MKKKITSILLAFVMMFGGVIAVKADGECTADTSTFTVTNTYKENNTDTEKPAQTFTYEVTKVGVSDAASTVIVDNMPTFTVTDTAYIEDDATTTHTINVNLPTTYSSVGVYTYTLKQTAGDDAGVNYSSEEYTIKVQVTNCADGTHTFDRQVFIYKGTGEVDSDDKASANFDNTYDAADLSVTKSVTGKLGDTTKKFNITVTLTPESGKDYTNITSSYTVAGGDSTTINWTSVGAVTVTLAHEETATFYNLPDGVTYTVVEDTYSDYTTTYTDNDDGTISNTNVAVTVTNNKDASIVTGIDLDNLPYILMVGLVGIALVVVVGKKHFAKED